MKNLELLESIENARAVYVKELIKIATSGYSSASQQVQAVRALEAIAKELSQTEEEEITYQEGEVIKIG